MLTVITGGSGSGKSEYAEQLIMSFDGEKRYYIATMKPYGEEGKKRVEKHWLQRKGRGFVTVEQYTEIENAHISYGADVLLECMSNLAANEMFDENTQRSPEQICSDILKGVEILYTKCNNLVIVTNEVFSDGNIYDRETGEYIRCLGMINRKLAKKADKAIEVVYSIPVVLNGD